jgi:hypothetical protein
LGARPESNDGACRRLKEKHPNLRIVGTFLDLILGFLSDFDIRISDLSLMKLLWDGGTVGRWTGGPVGR